MALTWILERSVYPDNHDRLADAVEKAGQSVISWDDSWWGSSKMSEYDGKQTIFHGCLENAARINAETDWSPGAYCKVDAFKCSSWYPDTEQWLIHSRWALTTVSAFMNSPIEILNEIEETDRFFVRPNSPLKPFSGRVLDVKNLSLNSLDYGFYYDDTSLDIIVAPVQNIQDEWRFIVIRGKIVAGSGYRADTRTETSADPEGASWKYAEKMADRIPAPENIYVMDICMVNGNLKLLELNPFSGADLYACDRDAIVKSITEAQEK